MFNHRWYGTYVIQTACLNGSSVGALQCSAAKVTQVCGPGAVGCNGYQNYVLPPGHPPIQLSTVPDCNWDNPGWRCHDIDGCVQIPLGSGTAQFATEADCLASGCLPVETWDCKFSGPLSNQGTCVSVAGPSGQYQTQQDCIDNCSRDKKYRCVPVETGPPNVLGEQSTSSMQCIADPMGPYNSMADCQANCPGRGNEGHCINCKEGIMNTLSAFGTKECPQGWVLVTNLQQGPCFECQNGNCVGPSWATGQNVYNSQTECQNGVPGQPACQPPMNDYDCINGQCQIQSGGQYTGPTALADCQANCPPQPNLWECDNGPNGCTQTSNGTYQSQAACETACCQDVITNYGWAINHPNATSAQACNRIFNQFGILGSFNPSTLPFDDGCEYDWLIGIAGVCGVSQNYYNLITGFIGGNNGCYGNPNAQNQGYGQGNPHQNSVCGKVEQFCEAPIGNNPGPSTPTQWYKCQWTQQEALNGGCVC